MQHFAGSDQPGLANRRFDEDFLMRARVQRLDWDRPWPALENLSGRKPRGLGATYGESAFSVGGEAAIGSWR